jgi:hypothetical protein
MKRYKVVDGAEKLHDLDFIYHVGIGRYCIKGTNLLVLVNGANPDGSGRFRYFYSHRHVNKRYDLTFEQFFNRLPESVKEDIIYHMDVFN